ncbi:MAG: hypothetical protein HKN12_06420 [Gemmatimonadetes bacterium]|nr:hypothetical protein [Gemmatimonadota bacterium]
MTRPTAAAVILGVALLAAVASPALAESRYSLRGDGEEVTSSRADHRALGGAETATRIPSLSGNPASLAFADRTTFYGTYDTEWIRTEESVTGAGNLVRKEYSGLVPNLGLIFPLPNGFRLGAGVLVSRRRGGVIEQNASVPDGLGGTVTYRQEFEGSGNLLRIPVLLARDFAGIQLGAGMDLMLLRTENRWMNDFSDVDPALAYLNSEDTDETNLGGFAFRSGVRTTFLDWISIGGWATIPTRLSGERRLRSEQAGTTDDLTVDFEAEFHPSYSAGIELLPAARWRIVADWVHEAWKDADPLSPVDEFVNVDRYAVGVEWKPEEKRGGLNWPVRVGFRTANLHVLDAGGREVTERIFTAGSGFGIAGGRGDIDWYVEYGIRGEQDTNEYREHLVRVGITLTGWEQWTRRRLPPEDDDW